ncbi:MAG: hypothetical protein HON65_00725 [Rhodospirillales bacterium]|nr:hypothetical protein [Rhodospirillales bacterium]
MWKTFWLFGGLGGGLFLTVLSTMLALTDVPDDATAYAILFAFMIVVLYLALICVAIWRAATKFQGNPTYKVLSKLAVAAFGASIFILVAGVLFVEIH